MIVQPNGIHFSSSQLNVASLGTGFLPEDTASTYGNPMLGLCKKLSLNQGASFGNSVFRNLHESLIHVLIAQFNDLAEIDYLKKILYSLSDAKLDCVMSQYKADQFIKMIMRFVSFSGKKIPQTSNIYVSSNETITFEAITNYKHAAIIFDTDEITAVFIKKQRLLLKGTHRIESYSCDTDGIMKLSNHIRKFF